MQRITISGRRANAACANSSFGTRRDSALTPTPTSGSCFPKPCRRSGPTRAFRVFAARKPALLLFVTFPDFPTPPVYDSLLLGGYIYVCTGLPFLASPRRSSCCCLHRCCPRTESLVLRNIFGEQAVVPTSHASGYMKLREVQGHGHDWWAPYKVRTCSCLVFRMFDLDVCVLSPAACVCFSISTDL